MRNTDKFSGIEGVYSVVSSIALYVLIPLFVKSHNLPGLVEKFTPKESKEAGLSQIHPNIQTIERVLHFLRHRLKFKDNYCLRKSIVLFYYLQRYNVQAVINIGLKVGEHYKACGHCWVSVGEYVLFEKSPVYQQYNIFLGQKGSINYWISS